MLAALSITWCYQQKTRLDHLSCGIGNIAIEADNAPERPSGAPEDEYIRHLLEGLAEKVYNGPNTVEFRNVEIEMILLLIRPYLGSKN